MNRRKKNHSVSFSKAKFILFFKRIWWADEIEQSLSIPQGNVNFFYSFLWEIKILLYITRHCNRIHLQAMYSKHRALLALFGSQTLFVIAFYWLNWRNNKIITTICISTATKFGERNVFFFQRTLSMNRMALVLKTIRLNHAHHLKYDIPHDHRVCKDRNDIDEKEGTKKRDNFSTEPQKRNLVQRKLLTLYIYLYRIGSFLYQLAFPFRRLFLSSALPLSFALPLPLSPPALSPSLSSSLSLWIPCLSRHWHIIFSVSRGSVVSVLLVILLHSVLLLVCWTGMGHECVLSSFCIPCVKYV